MTLIYRLILAVALAAAAFALLTRLPADTSGSLYVALVVGAAVLAAVFVSPLLGSDTDQPPARPAQEKAPAAKAAANKARGGDSASGGPRETGIVKWFNASKGYGFITRSSGEEIFVHYRSIEGSGRRVLREGQSVSYVLGKGEKGIQAEQVRTET